MAENKINFEDSEHTESLFGLVTKASEKTAQVAAVMVKRSPTIFGHTPSTIDHAGTPIERTNAVQQEQNKEMIKEKATDIGQSIAALGQILERKLSMRATAAPGLGNVSSSDIVETEVSVALGANKQG